MLQQILKDMHVDQEILAELDDNQKQTLFCKMREEQVRRWNIWNNELLDNITEKTHAKTKKTVTFLKGLDGEPWVWVMGEHQNDKSIEDILKEEAKEKARKMAEEETEEIRKQVEAQLVSEFLQLSPKIKYLKGPLESQENDIYCSVDELRKNISDTPNLDISSTYTFNYYQNKSNEFNLGHTPDVFQDVSLNKQKVAQKVAQWEKRLTEERTCEIFHKIQKKHLQVAKEAEEEEKLKEQLWREQEQKAKQAEQKIREIARRAREEHRLTSSFKIDDSSVNSISSGMPPGRTSVIDWYRQKEKIRSAGIDSSNKVETWFHGLITRLEAETLLADQPCGTYLVRLSERIWGYVISYKAKDKCKHYLVSATPKYHFLGSNEMEYNSLGDLISYHQQHPLAGGETLVYPCQKSTAFTIDELFGS